MTQQKTEPDQQSQSKQESSTDQQKDQPHYDTTREGDQFHNGSQAQYDDAFDEQVNERIEVKQTFTPLPSARRVDWVRQSFDTVELMVRTTRTMAEVPGLVMLRSQQAVSQIVADAARATLRELRR